MWLWEQRHWCGSGDIRAVGCGSGSRDTGVVLETLWLLDVAVGAETLVWSWRRN